MENAKEENEADKLKCARALSFPLSLSLSLSLPLSLEAFFRFPACASRCFAPNSVNLTFLVWLPRAGYPGSRAVGRSVAALNPQPRNSLLCSAAVKVCP